MRANRRTHSLLLGFALSLMMMPSGWASLDQRSEPTVTTDPREEEARALILSLTSARPEQRKEAADRLRSEHQWAVESLDQLVLETVNTMNAQLPQRLDQVTYFENVSFFGKQLIYHMRFLFGEGDIAPDQVVALKQELKRRLLNQVCPSASLAGFLAFGRMISVNTLFADHSSFFTSNIRWEDCLAR